MAKKIPCFDNFPTLKDKFDKLYNESMSDAEQRAVGLKIALDYHKELHGELETFKASINKKYKKAPYVQPSVDSEKVEKIKQEYDSQIQALGGEKAKVEPKVETPKVPQATKTKPFVSKSGNQEVVMDNGYLEVVNIKTKQEVSPDTRKKVLDEYVETVDFSEGKRAEEPSTEMLDKYPNDVIEEYVVDKSSNPLEVVEVFLRQEKVQGKPTTALDAGSRADLIADFGIPRIKRKGFERFGDKNLITMSMAKSYFGTASDKGLPIDTVAKSMSDYLDVEITPGDLVQFMIAYPNGIRQALKLKDNKVAAAARDKFAELTGLELTDSLAERVYLQGTEQQNKKLEELTNKEYESRQKLEKEYWEWYSKIDDGAKDGDSAKAGKDVTPAEGKRIEEKRIEVEKESFQEKVAQAEKEYKSAQAKLSKARQSQAEIGKEQQLDIMGNKPADNKLFGADISIAEKQIKKLQDEVDTAKENLDKAKADLDNVVPDNQMQMGLDGESETEKLVSKIRNLKIDTKGKTFDATLGLPVAVYNSAIEIVAKAIEGGAKLGNAIAKAMKYIDSQMGDKQWNKGFFAKEMNVRYSVTLPNGSNVEVERDTTKETAEVINGWYQPIEQKIIDTKQDSLPANKWAEILKSKEDEDLWTGVREFLQDKGKETVTKKELSDFIKENRVEIVEVVKGATSEFTEQELRDKITAEGYELEFDMGGEGYILLQDDEIVEYDELPENVKTWYDQLSEYTNPEDTTGQKYSQYQLKGEKENYKEVLVTLPSKASSLNDVSIDLYGIPFSQLKVEFPNSFESKESRVQEVRNRTIESGEGGKQFKSSHFEEPNIVVHLRMNTRTDAEGNKVLFLEEVQSDWGQQGKKAGFAGNSIFTAKQKSDGSWDVFQKGDFKKNVFANNEKEAIKTAGYNPDFAGTPTAPFVTDTNAWAKLGLKVALKEAVNQNVDKIAWTTGEQQNDRYSLEKVADEVRYKKNSDGTYEIIAYKAGENISEDKALREDKLEATLGKDVAKRVIDGVGEDIEGKKSLTGENLKVGGKGMKGFYGSPKEGSLGIIGNLAKSLFKQEPKTTKMVVRGKDFNDYEINKNNDGTYNVGIKNEDIYGDPDNGFETIEKARQFAENRIKEVKKENPPITTTQYSIDVTPELKLSVNNGLPLFGSEISTEQALKDTIAKELNKSANELGVFNIGSTKLWLSMAKLMGLYAKKGVTKFGDFIKATGYKATSVLKDLWDGITRKKTTPISKSVRNSKLKTLNARVLFYEALIGVDPLTDGQTQLDALKDTIATYKTLAIHANKNEVQDVINAVDALSDLYIELSADLNTVKDKIASQAANGQPTFELKDKLTIAGNAIKSFADDFKWQEKVQNEIEKVKGTLPDDMNPYMQKDISIGRVENTISEMTQKLFGKRYGELKTNKKSDKALFERAAKDKISQEDLDFFMYVQHAKERNARVEAAKIIEKTQAIQEAQDRLADLATQDQSNPSVKAQTTMAKQALSEAQSMPIVTDGSGMTNEEADRFMQEFEKSGKVPKLEEYAKEYRETVIKPMIDMMEEGNLLDADQAEMFRTGMDKKTGVKFDYFVPLKVEKEALEQSQGTISSGNPTLLNPIKSIKGTSKYDYVKRVSPIAQSISEFQAAAKAVEDNKTAQSLYKLVKENPNKDIWEIVSPTFMPNADGVPMNQTAQEVKDSSIPVKIDGKLKYVKINHKGLRDAWLRKPSDVDWFYKIILNTFRTYNNFKRKVLTQYSPEFALVNLIRDVQDAVFNSAGVDIPFLGKQIIGNLPKANATAAKAIYGNLDPDSDMGKRLDLYLASGGKISWANYNAIEDVQKEIDQLTAKFSDNKTLGYYGKNGFNKIVATIGAFNETVEIGTRLATFNALVDNGITPEKAASISKNMTVNFNKRGTATPLLNAAYLFSNAGIQSIYVGAKGLAKSQKARRYAAYTMLTGLAVPFIQQMMIAALSESDEEEKEYKQLLTKEEQLDYLVIPIGKGEFLRIPKSYGMTRLFLNSGQEIGSAMIDGKIAEHSVNAASTLLSVIDPITGNANNKISAAFPTALRPLIEVLAINKDYKNAPIYPEDRFGPESADYLKFYPKTADFYKNFAENMYFKSGSNIDVSPETLEYIVNDFFSGVFRTGENFIVAGTQLAQGKEVDPNKIPFKSKFIVDMSEQDWRYTKDFWNLYNNSEKVIYTEDEIKETIDLVKKLDAKRAKDGGPKAVKEFGEKIKTIKKGQEKLKEQKEAFEKKQAN